MAPENSVERLILLEAARSWFTGVASANLARLGGLLDDESTLVALAADQGMTGVLLRELDRADAILPERVMRALRGDAAQLVRGNLALTAELLRILGSCDAAGIRTLAYKGPVLALQAFGDVAIRRMSDLDVLVHPEDTPAALGTLQQLGYTPAYVLSAGQERAFRAVDGDYQLVHGETGTLVELHCRVSSTRFVIDMPTARLWARSRPALLAGRELRTLDDGDHLLVVALHGAKHRWRRLEWLLSFAIMARARVESAASAEPVGELLEDARRAGVTRELLAAWYLCERLFGLGMPGPVAAAIAGDGVVRVLADQVEHEVRHGAADDGAVQANLFFNLRLRRGVPDRLRYCARWLFQPTPEDWQAIALPERLSSLYAVIRPVRLAWHYARPGRPRESSDTRAVQASVAATGTSVASSLLV